MTDLSNYPQIEMVRHGSIHPNPRNPNRHNRKQRRGGRTGRFIRRTRASTATETTRVPLNLVTPIRPRPPEAFGPIPDLGHIA